MMNTTLNEFYMQISVVLLALRVFVSEKGIANKSKIHKLLQRQERSREKQRTHTTIHVLRVDHQGIAGHSWYFDSMELWTDLTC